MLNKTDLLNFFGRDYRVFFQRYGIEFKDRKTQTLVRCPWHDDQHPSLSIHTAEGAFHCFAGCASGNIFDFYARRHGLSTDGDFPRVLQGIAADFGIGGPAVGRPPAPVEKIDEDAPAADTAGERPSRLPVRPVGPELRAWLAAHGKAYGDATLQHFGIGESVYQGEPCLVIPIHDRLQKLYFWRRPNKHDRWQHHPGGKGWLIDENPDTEEVILCEGEWDFLCLYDRGYRGLATGTTGAGRLPKGLAEALKGKEVTLVYDRDKAGQEGAKKAAKSLQKYARLVRIAELPEAVGEGGDVSDYFYKLGGAAADFDADILRTAKPYEPAVETQAEAIDAMPDEADDRRLNPAQDGVDGLLHYAISIKKDPAKGRAEIYLVTSERRIRKVSDYEARGWAFTSKSVQKPRLSKAVVTRFLTGEFAVNPAELHQTMGEYISRYVVFKDPTNSAFLALWVMGTYVHKLFRYYPYVWLNSLVKGCGKSLLMEILRPLVFNGVAVVNPSLSSVFRFIAEGTPTFLMDELEWLGATDKDRQGPFMAVLNAGFNTAWSVTRTDATRSGRYENQDFSTYCPKMLAGLKELETTLRDRTIRIDMIRKAAERTEEYHVTPALRAFHQQVRDQLYGFGLTFAAEIARRYEPSQAVPVLDHLQNRERDLWRPIGLLAHLVDTAAGASHVVPLITALSQRSLRSKQTEDGAQEIIEVLLTWRELMATERPVEEDGPVAWYAQDVVFDFFRSTESFAWMETPKALTRRLQRVKIQVERRRTGSDLQRFYKVDRPEFTDLCERLIPP